jgi:hypothetical protein
METCANPIEALCLERQVSLPKLQAHLKCLVVARSLLESERIVLEACIQQSMRSDAGREKIPTAEVRRKDEGSARRGPDTEGAELEARVQSLLTRLVAKQVERELVNRVVEGHVRMAGARG